MTDKLSNNTPVPFIPSVDPSVLPDSPPPQEVAADPITPLPSMSPLAANPATEFGVPELKAETMIESDPPKAVAENPITPSVPPVPEENPAIRPPRASSAVGNKSGDPYIKQHHGLPKALIAGIASLVFLIGGLGAGVYLSRQKQSPKIEASVCSPNGVTERYCNSSVSPEANKCHSCQNNEWQEDSDCAGLTCNACGDTNNPNDNTTCQAGGGGGGGGGGGQAGTCTDTSCSADTNQFVRHFVCNSALIGGKCEPGTHGRGVVYDSGDNRNNKYASFRGDSCTSEQIDLFNNVGDPYTEGFVQFIARNNDFSNCGAPTSTPRPTPTPTSRPTPTPTPTPRPPSATPTPVAISANCESLVGQVSNGAGGWISKTDNEFMAAVRPGDRVRFVCTGHKTQGSFTKSAFFINSILHVDDVVKLNETQFAVEYTISAAGQLEVESVLLHDTKGWVD